MELRFPSPLRLGDRIGVTAPSSGVDGLRRGRLDFAVEWLRQRGYDVVVGECMDGSGVVSAPAADRARELTDMLVDPSIRAVIPPWGGETAIDLLPLLDWETIGAADPTWFVGYSDISTVIMPLTLLTGVATLHGNNLMDSPYRVPPPLLSWLDIAAMPARSTFSQASPGVHKEGPWDDWVAHAEVTEHTFNATGGWLRLDGGRGDVDVTGRLIGGCIESLCNLVGTPYADISRFSQEYAAKDGLIAYVEAAEDDAATICRNLHGMRLAGFFADARAVIVGRTRAPDHAGLTQDAAVLDALEPLGVPIIADVECGHVPPHLPIVNGALGRLRFGGDEQRLEQTLA
jgi:muramoyltetrapeptide carboxypeptidase LdcA involved in peptidoglycan recycling